MGEIKNDKLIARIVSIIGHPLLTISLLVVFLSFKELSIQEARLASLLIIGCITLPVVLHNVWKTYKGKYTNFDVSDQKQRKGFLGFALILLLAVSLLCQKIGLSVVLLHSMWLFSAMLFLFFLLNIKWKISLHSAINFYIAAILLHYSIYIGCGMMLLAILVSASRIALKRHTISETILGSMFGFLIGWINTFLL